MNDILLQTIYYAVVMLMTFVFADLLLQGFLHKFVRVFGSLGRLCFIKIRHSTFDGLAIGKEDEGFLVFKYKHKDYRIPIPNNERIFYRFLFVQWIDVDGEKWALCKADYSSVSGYDPVKIQNFIKRILMMPSEDDTFKKTVFIGLIVLGVLIIGCLVFSFVLFQKIDAVNIAVNQLSAKAGSIASTTV